MIEKCISLTGVTPFKREQAILLSNTANDYVSHIMMEYGNRTINGKSLLGLLSLGAVGPEPVKLRIEGDDEREAAEELYSVLQNALGGKVIEE